MTSMMKIPKKVIKEKISAMEDTDPKVVINLSVTAEFKKCLKAFAAAQEVTMSSLVVGVLNEHINNCVNEQLHN